MQRDSRQVWLHHGNGDQRTESKSAQRADNEDKTICDAKLHLCVLHRAGNVAKKIRSGAHLPNMPTPHRNARRRLVPMPRNIRKSPKNEMQTQRRFVSRDAPTARLK